MSSTIEADINQDYENRARSTIIPLCLEALQISVFMPEGGYQWHVTREEFAANGYNWPNHPIMTSAEEAEIDFLGHTNEIKSLAASGGTVTHPDNIYLLGTVSAKMMPHEESSTKSVNTSFTHEKTFPRPTYQGVKYIIGEVTFGGKKALLSKIQQIERDCLICLAMARTSNVLNVVSVAIVINPYERSQIVFDTIMQTRLQFPNVFKIYSAGRFVFLQYAETPTARLNAMQNELGLVTDELRTNLTDMRTDMSDIRTDITNIRSDMSTIQMGLEAKIDLLQATIGKLLNKLDAKM